MNKRYYWLKLHDDYFENANIKIIEDMDNGPAYLLFLFKLKLISVKTEGYLRVTDTLPYNEKTLATVTNSNVDLVRTAMKIFQQFDLIEILPDDTIYVKCIELLIGSESEVAERVRKHRAKQKALHSNKVKQISNTDIELELEKDIEIEKKGKSTSPPKKKYQEYAYLAETEYEKLTTEYEEKIVQDFIGRLSDYIGQIGPKKAAKYKSHYHTIKNWMRLDGIEKRKKRVKDMTTKEKIEAGYLAPHEVAAIDAEKEKKNEL